MVIVRSSGIMVSRMCHTKGSRTPIVWPGGNGLATTKYVVFGSSIMESGVVTTTVVSDVLLSMVDAVDNGAVVIAS